MSGTYNPTAFNNPESRPEILDALVIGLKSQLFNRRLTVNIKIFTCDYKNIQMRSTAPRHLQVGRCCSTRAGPR